MELTQTRKASKKQRIAPQCPWLLMPSQVGMSAAGKSKAAVPGLFLLMAVLA
jgi:hypothetical protein